MFFEAFFVYVLDSTALFMTCRLCRTQSSLRIIYSASSVLVTETKDYCITSALMLMAVSQVRSILGVEFRIRLFVIKIFAENSRISNKDLYRTLSVSKYFRGRTNWESALLNYSCRWGSYYSGGRTNRGGRSNRGGTVCPQRFWFFLRFTQNIPWT